MENEKQVRRSTRVVRAKTPPKPSATPRRKRSISPKKVTSRTNKRGTKQLYTVSEHPQIRRISPSYRKPTRNDKNRGYWPKGFEPEPISESEKTCVGFVMQKFGIWDYEALTESKLSKAEKQLVDICLRIIDNEKVSEKEIQLVDEFAINHEDYRDAMRKKIIRASNKELDAMRKK